MRSVYVVGPRSQATFEAFGLQRVLLLMPGVLIEGFELGSTIRSLAGNDLFILSALRVQRCRVQLPTLHQPLSIQLSGACAELTQRQLPEVQSCLST